MIIKELDANKMIENYHSGPKIKKYNQNIILEKSEKWIRGTINDEIIIDSKNTFILLENGHLPIYYFPKNCVRMDLLIKNTKTTFCPLKGTATYWDFNYENNNIIRFCLVL